MELTNILGTSFLVNVDSVVYAYTRGSGATLVMSRNKELVYVTESVSEVVTASGTGLVAFTATEGDVTGSVAINPNYIQTVTSVDGGDSSGLILGDNSGVRATLVVTTDYADMDAIVEVPTVLAKTTDFTANGASGTIYTNEGAEDNVVATLDPATTNGTEYKFFYADDANTFSIIIPDGHTFYYSIGGSVNPGSISGDGVTTTDFFSLGGLIEITKVSSIVWFGSLNGVNVTS